MAAFDIILWHDAIILNSGFAKKFSGICFLEKSITDVFLVSKDFVNGTGVPPYFTGTGEYAITFKACRNLIHRVTIQVLAIDSFDDFCLLRIND